MWWKYEPIWCWLRRCRLRALRQLARFFRFAPRLRGVRFGYEKAGLRVDDEPVPWNADAVHVEATVVCPGGGPEPLADFTLQTPGCESIKATGCLPTAEEDVYQVFFRFAPLAAPATLQVCWRSVVLGRLLLPIRSFLDVLKSVRLEGPTIFARLGPHRVACRTLVEGQGQEVTACGMLQSVGSLLPLVEWGVVVEATNLGTGQSCRIPASLTGCQLLAAQAVLGVELPDWFDRPGLCVVCWTVADRLLASAEIRVISVADFQRSLYLCGKELPDSEQSGMPLHVYPAPSRNGGGLRSRFRVASREPGIVALCHLEADVQFRDNDGLPLCIGDEVLVTDSPPLCLPLEVPIAEVEAVESFQLSSEGRFLGIVTWGAAPKAAFNSEGGFRAPTDFDWNALADVELQERLSRLTGPLPATP
jgi:hypothetical protein